MCVSVNNKLWGKPYLMSCELDNFTCKVLYYVIVDRYFIKAK